MRKTRITALVLAAACMLMMLPTAAFAAGDEWETIRISSTANKKITGKIVKEPDAYFEVVGNAKDGKVESVDNFKMKNVARFSNWQNVAALNEAVNGSVTLAGAATEKKFKFNVQGDVAVYTAEKEGKYALKQFVGAKLKTDGTFDSTRKGELQLLLDKTTFSDLQDLTVTADYYIDDAQYYTSGNKAMTANDAFLNIKGARQSSGTNSVSGGTMRELTFGKWSHLEGTLSQFNANGSLFNDTRKDLVNLQVTTPAAYADDADLNNPPGVYVNSLYFYKQSSVPTGPITVLGALYDTDGKLVEVAHENVAAENVKCSTDFELSFTNDPSEFKTVVYAWDSIEGMKPLCGGSVAAVAAE